MVEIDSRIEKTIAPESGLIIVVGIPAYNEEKTIARIVLGAQKYAHVVVVCDDGSTDLTGEIAERLGAVVVRHAKNFGYGSALQSLFKRARDLQADVLVTIDSDGQHDPEEIPRLIKPIEDGVAEVVFGSRFKDQAGTAEMPAYRQLGVKVITKLANGTGNNTVSDGQSGFRAYGKIALARLSMSEKGMGASIEILRAVKKNGLRVYEVPISCRYSNSLGGGTSSENSVTHGIGLLWSIIKLVVEDHPLIYLGVPGIICLFIGVGIGAWLLELYSITRVLETNIAIASAGFTLTGFFTISTAITLYAITRLSEKINTKQPC
jgi:glycosyltransferase involved in cell wall biosynthesis